MIRLFTVTVLSSLTIVPTANAVVYCTSEGVPKGCVVAPGVPGRGAPGAGGVDPGRNQPGAAGNVGAPRAGVGAPGVGVGAPGPGAVDPGINQPGAAGNVGEPANRGGPVDRAGRR